MRDYIELVKALMCCVDGSCEGCPRLQTPESEFDCKNKLKTDAADAIEELEAAVPKWISVEERLPKKYKPVLVTYVSFNDNSLLSDMVAYRDGDGDWCWWDGEFPSGEICKVKITHWLPLPAPPKEVLPNGEV